MSAHCITGYRTWEEGISTESSRPMIVEHRITRETELREEIWSTSRQYSSPRSAISFDAHLNCTCSRSIPHAFHTSIMYSPTTWIFFRSPPIFWFRAAK